MTKADIRTLVKGFEKKTLSDATILELLESLEEIASASPDDDEPRLCIPYVNASALGTGVWK